MIGKKHLLILLSLLFMLTCSREDFSPGLQETGNTQTGEPMTKAAINDFILKKLHERNDVFRWDLADDHMLWSAAVRSDSILAIGFKPADEGDIRERMHLIDLQDQVWRNARKKIQDYILEETNRKYPGQNFKLEDLLAFEENAYLPIITIRVFDEDILTELRRMPEVRYVDPIGYTYDEVRDRSDSGCGISPSFSISGDFTTIVPNAKVPWNFYNMNIPAAWNTSQGDNITIAVIDTGTSPNQENVGSAFTSDPTYSGGRFVDRVGTQITGWWWWASNAGPNDECGHGTQMSGLATAPRGSDGNSVGVAYKANLLSIRAVSDVVIYGSSEVDGVTNAIVLAANRADVKIMSMSIGNIFWFNSIADAIYYAYYSRGKLMFCAAGTSTWFTSWTGVVFPASMFETTAVTGIKDGFPLVKCNTCHSGSAVDFVAVMQRRNDNSRTSLTLAMSGNQPSRVGGSSAATATTAGIAALVWATNPNMNRSQVLDRLKNAASIYPNRDSDFGWGIIDAAAAVN